MYNEKSHYNGVIPDRNEIDEWTNHIKNHVLPVKSRIKTKHAVYTLEPENFVYCSVAIRWFYEIYKLVYCFHSLRLYDQLLVNP